MTPPTGPQLDAWVAETVRLARNAARRGQTEIAGLLNDLSNFLAELRDQKPPTLHRIEIGREWLYWIAAQSYEAGRCRLEAPHFSEASPNIRDFMVNRVTATIKALGVAHRALSTNPNAQPPTDNIRGDVL